MESQEHTLQRFNAFWLVMLIIGVCAGLGFVVRWSGAPKDEIDAEAAAIRSARLVDVRAAQQKEVAALGLHWQDPQGGHLPLITVPDELIAKVLPSLKARAMKATAIQTPEALAAAQAKAAASGKHDPTESEFLKK
jgi:DMSO/TMAO reductase YedYZ molybdopterin-dependent catalytic subunit